MPKKYQDRAMATPQDDRVFVPGKGQYFFPKSSRGPIVIEAKNIKEAEDKLAELDNNK